MKLAKSLALVGLASVGSAAYAADAPAPAAPAAPSLTDVLASSGLAVTGYVSAQYDNVSGVFPTYRQFDLQKNGFTMNQAGLQIAYQPKEGFGGVVQLIAGKDAEVVDFAERGSTSNFDVLQAYAQYVTGPMTLIAGKFLTNAGAEVIAPTGNTNISRSLTFFAEPLTHTGVRATFAANDQVNLIIGVNNGWNITSDNNNSKTVELGATFAPSKAVSLALNAYIGKEPVGGGDGTRTLIDFVGTWNATDALTLILNYDFGKQAFPGAADGKWNTGALYVNYAINPAWRVSARLEQLNDKDGLITSTSFPGGQKVKEGTLTFGYSPSKNFEFRLEGRWDKSDHQVFVKNIGPADDKQSSIEFEGLFKF
jgi:hypothetical protein